MHLVSRLEKSVNSRDARIALRLMEGTATPEQRDALELAIAALAILSFTPDPVEPVLFHDGRTICWQPGHWYDLVTGHGAPDPLKE